VAVRARPKLNMRTVDDHQSLAVDEGLGHLGPGRGEKPLDGGPGNAHLPAGFLLIQVEKITEPQRLQLVELEENGLEAAWRYPHGDEGPMGWESPAAARFQWPRHVKECTRESP